MKKLVSVLGSIIMGINAGAVYSNAMCCAAPSEESCKNSLPTISKENGWNEIEKQENSGSARMLIKREALSRICALVKQAGWINFKQNAENHASLVETLKKTIERSLYGCCYVTPDTLKIKGFWPFSKEYYLLFENKNNINLVKRNLPDFLKKLSIYLGSKDSKDKSGLKEEMKASLNELPEQLSDNIVAALKKHGVVL